MYTLIIEDRNGAIADEYSFDEGEFVIGRSLQSDIILPSDNVSRRHARLYTQGGHCFIEDLGSANGVFLNGRRIEVTQEILHTGQIKVGDYYLHIDSTANGEANSGPIYCTLTGLNLGVAGRAYTICRPVSIIGRGRDCTTTIIDPSVSRVHATLWVDEDGALRIEDLKSANGTFVAGQRIGTATLKDGDRLRLGNVELEVRLPEVMPRPSAKASPSPRSTSLVQRPKPTPVPSRPREELVAEAVEVPEALDVEAPDDDAWVAYRRRNRLIAVGIVSLAAVIIAVLVALYYRGKTSDVPAAPTEVAATSEGETEAEGGAPGEEPGPSEGASAEGAPGPETTTPAGKTGAPIADSSGKLPAREGKTTPGEPDKKSPKPTAEATSPTQVSEMDLLKQGEALLRDRKWAEAKALFAKLRDADPLSPTYQSLFNKANLEDKNRSHLEGGRKNLEQRMFAEALREFQAVTVQSAYREEARTEVGKLLDRKDELVHQGDTLCKEKSYQACHDHYVDAYAITPDDGALSDKLAKVRKRLGK